MDLAPSQGQRMEMSEEEGDDGVVEVELENGLLRLERVGDDVIMSRVGSWREQLSIEEAWRLAEALDSLATRAPGG